jgi:hypothetical protein
MAMKLRDKEAKTTTKTRAGEGRKEEKRESSVLTVTDDDSERNERF